MRKQTKYDIRYSFRIEKEFLEDVIKYCEKNNTTVSKLIRECLKKELDNAKE